ncbi:hypothetical protein Flexsi_0609 [Flexistipes sinusarabici DSM 4947]|uniref:Uncharacterized protein n=1 Tax=Flexistipes sinusarabici (strain ATCC 49648 / DSM 4947 / MAS 10) TaxID=717231 RepID=F8E3L4_FLESM|nr:hypothetical protein [Flexistipes sinusarabici]AEI14287.1 hypothetical protein Flexsi_0609 [Flexistipes sinusarabici DSM 4947]
MSEENNLNNIFISGWGGYKELFPIIAQKTDFYVPFIAPIDVIKRSIKKGGKTAMGWSTGAHILLKYAPEYIDKWDKIIVIAPFSDFTKSFGSKILDAMIRGINQNFYSTMNNFYKRCGIKENVKVDKKDVEKLKSGLNFLKTSILVKGIDSSKITVIYGTNDRIVKNNEIIQILKMFNNACYIEVQQQHFVNEKFVAQFL